MMELSPSQRQYWEKRLEDSERAVELAKRVLGIIAVENSAEKDDETIDQA